MTERVTTRTIVIGGAAGAWGDSSFAAPQLLDAECCDYIVFEALAEITMAILTRARERDAALGYATDVISMIGRDAARFREQGVRVVTNAGGINPRSAANVLRSIAAENGVSLRIAVVEGDDLGDEIGALRELELAEIHDGSPIPEDPISFNAYLGARPIAAALDAGADVVITGRCVDSALVLGPLIHEFGWGADALDELAQGSLAGHLLECGTQATGGLLTDWEDVPSWEDIGYPLAECRADGTFVLTKPDGTGGLVDERTVSEQLLYEIGDPARYLLPDVTCDWRSVSLTKLGADRIEVKGARGRPAPQTFKACAQVLDGFKVSTLIFIGGREATKKGERLGRDVLRRVERLLSREGFNALRQYQVEVLGAESTYGPFSRARDAREVVVKLTMHHDERAALVAAVREIPSFGLAVPGLSGGGTGRPKPTPLIQLRSYLVPRDFARATIRVGDEPIAFEPAVPAAAIAPPSIEPTPPPSAVVDWVEVPLIAIAHGRSGDKGPHANIGIRARHPDFFPLLCAQLTVAAVGDRFLHLIAGPVERYELPGVHALNFFLRDALGGGGIASLRFDAQGKAYAQQLLDHPIEIPRSWLQHAAVRDR